MVIYVCIYVWRNSHNRNCGGSYKKDSKYLRNAIQIFFLFLLIIFLDKILAYNLTPHYPNSLLRL